MAERTVSTTDDSATVNYEQFDINRNILLKYDDEEIRTAKRIFYIILEDWMYNYKKVYTANHFSILFTRVLDLVHRKKVLDFLLPGFPAKSSNDVSKVLGTNVDFGEYLALQTLMRTGRKIEEIYEYGVLISILSDYHTFDQYIGVEEEVYYQYHLGLNSMIAEMGGGNIFRVVSLASFPEFKDTASFNLSSKLNNDYGSEEFVRNFEENVKEDEALLERYKQMKKFMTTDLATRLPSRSPSSKRNKRFLKRVAVGMMAQGIALDTFLKQQTLLVDYIRISIHAHHPSKGKFAVDLFKVYTSEDHILRTPWHHTVLLDTKEDVFLVGRKQNLINEYVGSSVMVTVYYKENPWLLIRLYIDEKSEFEVNTGDLTANMIKQGCGMIIRNSSQNPDLPSSVIKNATLTSLIKHFGLVVLQGFKQFDKEEELYNQYHAHSINGVIPWKNGPVHKVKFSNSNPGIVNQRGPLPMHWDLSFPPGYMNISQSDHQYKDYTPREFLLYCHRNSKHGKRGPTTFVDAAGVALSVPGYIAKEWKKVDLTYETRLVGRKSEEEVGHVNNENLNSSEGKKSLYFGGKGNTFHHPLMMECPWTRQLVLRWQEMWSLKDHPGTVQEQVYKIRNREEVSITERELEDQVRKLAFDERFYIKYCSEEGDQVYVNNYTTLHGRESFTNERELWRVQRAPPTNNIPEYFKEFGHRYYTVDH